MARRELAQQALGDVGGVLAGFRNKIINGDFDIWQRGTSSTASGYVTEDRWNNVFNGGSQTHSQQAHTLGQTSVPGNPRYFSRTVVTHAAGSGNRHAKFQPIEGAKTLSSKLVTITFWAKADASKNIAVELSQSFGTGGSPSAAVVGVAVTTCALTTAWQKFSFTGTFPSISGKTLGSNGDDSCSVGFWFEGGSTFDARTNTLGQQSGTFDISHVSVVEGDATQEADPFSARHPQQEMALCERYYQTGVAQSMGYGNNGNAVGHYAPLRTRMRAVPTVGSSGQSYAGVITTGAAAASSSDPGSIAHAFGTPGSNGGYIVSYAFTAAAEI